MGQKLSDTIGASFTHHAVMVVRKGKFEEAVRFFVEELGWAEARRTGLQPWGQAAFVIDLLEFEIQLTEPPNRLRRRPKYVHVALVVENPAGAAQAMVDWARQQKMRGSCEEAGDGKWFVKLPDIFHTDIELVPTKN